MKTAVLLFGSFDPLHGGHIWLFEQAKKKGNHLTVVVARDNTIRSSKGRDPYQPEQGRLRAVNNMPMVDETLLGDEDPTAYVLLKERDFDVLVLGYDQKPSNQEIRVMLDTFGKHHVQIVRLPALKPAQYKSSLLRKGSQ